MATKTTIVVFKQHNPQIIAMLIFVAGTPSQPHNGFKLKKTTFFGDFRLKIAPHRRFVGSKFLAPIFYRSSIKNQKNKFLLNLVALTPKKLWTSLKKLTLRLLLVFLASSYKKIIQADSPNIAAENQKWSCWRVVVKLESNLQKTSKLM